MLFASFLFVFFLFQRSSIDLLVKRVHSAQITGAELCDKLNFCLLLFIFGGESLFSQAVTA